MPESAKTKEFVRYLAYLKDNGYGKYKCENLYRYYLEWRVVEVEQGETIEDSDLIIN